MQLEIDKDFGAIEMVRSNRAKRINVRILPDKLRVSLPVGLVEEDAIRFINSVRARILKKQNLLKGRVKNTNLLLSEESGLETLTFSVVLRRIKRNDIFYSFRDAVLNIEFPQDFNSETKVAQDHFWRGIEYFLKKEAKRLLPFRTKQLADKYHFSFSTVKIQSSKSRWGSCSGVQNINLSCYLLLLPQHLIDYVILHELCHTKEMNHGPKFWQWMDRVTENRSKELRRELKENYTIPK